MNKKRIIIIGGGIVGLATARSVSKVFPNHNILLLEKENRAGQHQSTHNSGVLHCGLYYKPGSLKARLAVSGIKQMTEFCQSKNIPHEICGKVVVATNEIEVIRLKELHERGIANGLEGVRWLGAEELREVEPNAAGIAALHVPQEGIVDYQAVIDKLQEQLISECGVNCIYNTRVFAIKNNSKEWLLETTSGEHTGEYIINCAGLFCDRVAEMTGVKEKVKIIPFRGEYYKLTKEGESLVRHLIYPVPAPEFPFLGVHFTRMIGGGVEAGPNAVLALSREGYTKKDIDLKDIVDSLGYPGLWRFLHKYPKMVTEEVLRSFNKSLFTSSLQKLVPAIQKHHLTTGGSGVRAQAMLSNGSLVQDFHLVRSPKALHVLNAPSPAATASLAIGNYLAREFKEVIL